jgi:hypothetical protein
MPLPSINLPWVDPKTGIPTQAFAQFMNATFTSNGVDLLVRALRSKPVTFANRPQPASEGMIVAFADSTTNTPGAAISGNGTLHVLGYYDNTSWKVCG